VALKVQVVNLPACGLLDAESFLKSLVPQLVKASQHFMEHVGSLQCSQEATTDPHPEPDQSSSCPPNKSVKDQL
jgi:hypothetical protein